MIPYEDLVAALSRWRARQGLPSGPGDYLGEPAQASYQGYVAPPPSGSRPMAAVVEDEVEYMNDDLLEESKPGGPPYGDVETQEYDTASDVTHDDPITYEAPGPRSDTEADGRGRKRR
ncbi:MAG TPA: hypothetical protein VMZ28_12305 [Kofleriaceae bacterium]|nr:hypothetical protein [Kofleriaceae bacterium]